MRYNFISKIDSFCVHWRHSSTSQITQSFIRFISSQFLEMFIRLLIQVKWTANHWVFAVEVILMKSFTAFQDESHSFNELVKITQSTIFIPTLIKLHSLEVHNNHSMLSHESHSMLALVQIILTRNQHWTLTEFIRATQFLSGLVAQWSL